MGTPEIFELSRLLRQNRGSYPALLALLGVATAVVAALGTLWTALADRFHAAPHVVNAAALVGMWAVVCAGWLVSTRLLRIHLWPRRDGRVRIGIIRPRAATYELELKAAEFRAAYFTPEIARLALACTRLGAEDTWVRSGLRIEEVPTLLAEFAENQPSWVLRWYGFDALVSGVLQGQTARSGSTIVARVSLATQTGEDHRESRVSDEGKADDTKAAQQRAYAEIDNLFPRTPGPTLTRFAASLIFAPDDSLQRLAFLLVTLLVASKGDARIASTVQEGLALEVLPRLEPLTLDQLLQGDVRAVCAMLTSAWSGHHLRTDDAAHGYRPEVLLAIAEHVVRVLPDVATCWYRLGAFRCTVGDASGSRAAFVKAMELESTPSLQTAEPEHVRETYRRWRRAITGTLRSLHADDAHHSEASAARYAALAAMARTAFDKEAWARWVEEMINGKDGADWGAWIRFVKHLPAPSAAESVLLWLLGQDSDERTAPAA